MKKTRQKSEAHVKQELKKEIKVKREVYEDDEVDKSYIKKLTTSVIRPDKFSSECAEFILTREFLDKHPLVNTHYDKCDYYKYVFDTKSYTENELHNLINCEEYNNEEFFNERLGRAITSLSEGEEDKILEKNPLKFHENQDYKKRVKTLNLGMENEEEEGKKKKKSRECYCGRRNKPRSISTINAGGRPRRHYRKDEVAYYLVEHLIKKIPIRTIALKNPVPEPTIKRMVASFRKEGMNYLYRARVQSSGNKKFQDYHKDFIKDCAEKPQNSTLTGKQRLKMFKEKFPDVEITQSGYIKQLKKLGYSYKKTSIVPKQVSTFKVRAQRKLVVNKILQLYDSDHVIISLDESGFGLDSNRRGFGWSKLGHAVVHEVDPNQVYYTLLAAATKTNILSFQVREGSYRFDTFYAFLQETITISKELYNKKKIVLYMDNVKVHRVEDIKNLAIREKVYLIYNAPYSPHINPIENIFAIWKSFVQREYNDDKNDLVSLIIQKGLNFSEKAIMGCFRRSFRFFLASFHMKQILNRIR